MFFSSPVKDTSKDSWQMFLTVNLLMTFSPGKDSDKVKKRQETQTGLMFWKKPLTYDDLMEVYNTVSVVGRHHQRRSHRRTLQLQVKGVDGTVKNITTIRNQPILKRPE